MNIKIHGGADTIGGNCVEVTSGQDRIILDFGWPLSSPTEDDIQKRLKRDTTQQLIASKRIADIPGLYAHDTPSVKAVLLSHYHPDHYGFLSHIHKDIPIYSSVITGRVLALAYLFKQSPRISAKISRLDPYKPFGGIPGFTITPYETDHSAAGAFAFKIEATNEKKTLFYSGDLSGHLNKKYLFEKLLRYDWDIDCLILEGTNIQGRETPYKSEESVRDGFVKLFRASSELAIVACSSQNIDRLCSLYSASRGAKRTLVIDPYTAYILDRVSIASKSIPQAGWDGIKVYFPEKSSYTRILQKVKPLFYNRFKKFEISMDEIVKNREKMVVKDSYYTRTALFEALGEAAPKPLVIYSLWEGYLDRDGGAWEKFGIRPEDMQKVHTSGHASRAELETLAAAMTPRTLCPIHTQHPELFKEIFKGTEVKTFTPGTSIEFNI